MHLSSEKNITKSIILAGTSGGVDANVAVQLEDMENVFSEQNKSTLWPVKNEVCDVNMPVL